MLAATTNPRRCAARGGVNSSPPRTGASSGRGRGPTATSSACASVTPQRKRSGGWRRRGAPFFTPRFARCGCESTDRDVRLFHRPLVARPAENLAVTQSAGAAILSADDVIRLPTSRASIASPVAKRQAFPAPSVVGAVFRPPTLAVGPPCHLPASCPPPSSSDHRQRETVGVLLG